MKYVAGIDGGGTKTTVALANMDGTLLFRTEVSALNFNGQPRERTRGTLESIIRVLENAPGGIMGCACLCIATAGISNPEAREFVLNGIQELGYHGKLRLAGDEHAALYGAMGRGEGIVLIAGTGSVCYGQNAAGQSARTGGWGYLIDDAGSGYALGREILSSVLQAYDGRIPPTGLTGLVLERLGISHAEEIIRYVYDPDTGKTGIASLAPLLSEGLEADDAESYRIARDAACRLAGMVTAVARRLGIACGQISLCGSVLEKNPIIAELTKNEILRLLPEARLTKPKFDSAIGAVHMALEEI